MLRKHISFKKAAYLFAAFFIFKPAFCFSENEKKSFEIVKEKAKKKLLQKQKNEAIQILVDFIKIENNKAIASEAADVLSKISQTFLSKDAQDDYETSLNLSAENPKEAKKLIENCLALEPKNLDCLIQRIKIYYVEKNRAEVDKTFESLIEFAKGTEAAAWVEVYLNKDNNLAQFKNKSLVKRFAVDKPTEDFFVLSILEIERAFAVNNYARAKEGVDFLEKNYSEYPDIHFFKQKLEAESAEDKRDVSIEPNLMYLSKCKNLTKSLARRFRYDFNLCQRGS